MKENASALNLPILKRAQTGHPTSRRLDEEFICNTPPKVKLKAEQHHRRARCGFKSAKTWEVQPAPTVVSRGETLQRILTVTISTAQNLRKHYCFT